MLVGPKIKFGTEFGPIGLFTISTFPLQAQGIIYKTWPPKGRPGPASTGIGFTATSKTPMATTATTFNLISENILNISKILK